MDGDIRPSTLQYLMFVSISFTSGVKKNLVVVPSVTQGIVVNGGTIIDMSKYLLILCIHKFLQLPVVVLHYS